MSTLATYAVTALGGLAYGLLLYVVASGLELIVGVMKVINLAHGASYLAGTALAYLLTDGTMTSVVIALLAGIIVATLGGAALSVLLRPLAGHTEQAVVTLGLGFIAAWTFTGVSDGNTLVPPRPAILDGQVSVAGHGYPVYHLAFIGVAGVLAATMHLVLRHSLAGIRLRAAVDDPQMATATGMSATAIRIMAFAVGTVLAVTAGVVGAPVLSPGPGVDSTVLTLSLIVVILAGPGARIGSLLIAAIGVGMIETVGVSTVPALASFSLLLAVIVVLLVRGHRGLHTVAAA